MSINLVGRKEKIISPLKKRKRKNQECKNSINMSHKRVFLLSFLKPFPHKQGNKATLARGVTERMRKNIQLRREDKDHELRRQKIGAFKFLINEITLFFVII